MSKVDQEYKKTLDYLLEQLPMFQRVGEKAFKKDLKNIQILTRNLETPHAKFPSIHIAGTNGKGSTTHILASILQHKGKRVGVYTSPHYQDFRERIKINGSLVPQKFVIDFVAKHKELFEKIQPSFFEISVAMAFTYFAEQKVDIAIIETGLGGRLDSTNIITPILSIITNISLDHTDFLGDTLEEIAEEKAGIIKAGIPVVIGEKNAKTAKVFQQKVEDKNAPIYFARDIYHVVPTIRALTHSIFNVYKNKRLWMKDLESDISGLFQGENFTSVIQAIDILNQQGYHISEEDIRTAALKIKSSTFFIGRMQVLSLSPLIIADSGHNEGALSKTIEEILDKNFTHIHFVIGFVKDKKIDTMLSFFPKEKASYYIAKADIPRGLDVETLSSKMQELNLPVVSYSSVKDALAAAKNKVKSNECIYIGGSTFIVAEIVEHQK